MDAKKNLLLSHGELSPQLLLTGAKRTKIGKRIQVVGKTFIASINLFQPATLLDAKLNQSFIHILTLFHLSLLFGVKTMNIGNLITSGYLNKDQFQLAPLLDAKKNLLPSHGELSPQPPLTGAKRTKIGKKTLVVGKTFTALSNLIKNLDQLALLSNANLALLLLISPHQTRKLKITMFQTSVRIKKSLPQSNISLKERLNMEHGI